MAEIAQVAERFVGVREFAETLGLITRAVQQAIARGDLVATRIGDRGAFRIPAGELHRHLPMEADSCPEPD